MNWKQSRNQYGVFVLAILGLIWFMSGRARAHVQYVTPGGEPAAVVTFLLNALSDPVNIALLIGGAVSALLVGGAIYGIARSSEILQSFEIRC